MSVTTPPWGIRHFSLESNCGMVGFNIERFMSHDLILIQYKHYHASGVTSDENNGF
jgi:hypothetical protein